MKFNWFKRKKKEEPPKHSFSEFIEKEERNRLKQMSENFRLYYFCPNCDKYEPYCEAPQFCSPNDPLLGCCPRCGTLKSKWILASAKLDGHGGFQNDNLWGWLISSHDESDIMKYHKGFMRAEEIMGESKSKSKSKR